MKRQDERYRFWERGGFAVDASVKLGGDERAFETVPDPALCVVFLQQHIGAPNVPVVEPGDEVMEGQKLGDSSEPMGVPVHAPVAGRILKIDMAHHPVKEAPGEAVFIERAESSRSPERLPGFSLDQLDQAAPEALVQAVREAGVVGLGGAAFPAHVKLAFREKATHLIVNAKESDPNVACDVRLKKERPDEIVAGIRAMMRMLEPQETIFATRAEAGAFPELEAQLRAWGIRIAHIRSSYSVGSDKLLVKELLGKEVPCGAYPPDVGAVVHNVFTAFAVARALFHGEPLVARGMTLVARKTGPRNLWVKVGTPVDDVLRHVGVDPSDVQRLTLASLMMGGAIPHAQVPVVKATAGISVFGPEERSPYERERACIRCGYCNMVCPVRIYPVLIMEAMKRGRTANLTKLHAEDCIDCGLCSYVCPSSIKLTRYLREAMVAVRSG